jgi:ribosomal protein S18 acetylase RimI-like enzyme
MHAPVRLAVSGDLPSLLVLYRHLHPDDPGVTDEVAQAVWAQMLSHPNNKVLVIDGEGELASTCTVTIVPTLNRGARPYAVIENVVTHPDYRQKGLGGAVVRAAIDAASAADAYKIFLTTGSQQESTLRFYESLGFQKNGRTLFDIRKL